MGLWLHAEGSADLTGAGSGGGASLPWLPAGLLRVRRQRRLDSWSFPAGREMLGDMSAEDPDCLRRPLEVLAARPGPPRRVCGCVYSKH